MQKQNIIELANLLSRIEGLAKTEKETAASRIESIVGLIDEFKSENLNKTELGEEIQSDS